MTNDDLLKNELTALKEKYELDLLDQATLEQVIKNLSHHQPTQQKEKSYYQDIIKLSKKISTLPMNKVQKIYK